MLEGMGQMAEAYTLHIVPHTHWDREWYFTLEEYRYRLVRLVDTLLRCLDEGSIEVFTFDGQTIAMEDYLAVRPEQRDKLRKYIAAGRILVGPWYTQPNTFMSGGEALVRNLLRGRADMAAWGGGMERINYLPDQFGFNAQLPQLMAGFGMTHLVGGRGMPKGCETYLRWEGSDGTQVKICALVHSYNNGNGLSPLEERKSFAVLGGRISMPSLPEQLDIILSEGPRSPTGNLLVMNGVDHMFPNTAMGATLEKIRALHPELTPVQSTFERYIACVERDLPGEATLVRGELRDGRENLVLPASQSMRMDVKCYNRRMEDLLQRRVEPLLCLMKALGERDLPEAHLRLAWQYLLENQAHDSLCCANAEASYREILVRYDKIADIGREMVMELSQRLMRLIKGLPQEAVLVYNPSPFARNEPIRLEIAVAAERDFPQPRLFTPEGREVRTWVQGVRRDTLLRFVPFSGRVGELPVDIFTLTADLDGVEALGYRLLAVAGGGVQDIPVVGLVTAPAQIENECLRVTVNADGTLDIADKRTGRVYAGTHRFLDDGEAGNGFMHIPPAADCTCVSAGQGLGVTIVENNDAVGTLRVEQTLSLPAGLEPDGGRRGGKAEVKIQTEITLRRGCEYVAFHTRVKNGARDHRLRVAFPTDIASDPAYAGQPFDVVRRRIQPERPNHYGPGDLEAPVGYHPMTDFCGIEDGEQGVAIAGNGLMEYEVLPMRRTICVTLLRATDRLLEGVLAQGDKFRLPAAQMQGTYGFDYAFIPYAGDYEAAMPQIEAFRYPLEAVQKDFLEGESMPDYAPPAACLPPSGGFLTLEGGCALTAVKPSERGDGAILRAYNPGEGTKCLSIGAGLLPLGAAKLVRLDETELRDLDAEAGRLALEVERKKIVSVKLAWPGTGGRDEKARNGEAGQR